MCARVRQKSGSRNGRASLVKCSRKAVRNALSNYTFDTFNGHKPRRDCQRITTNDEYKAKNTLKHNSFLPLRDITNLLPVKVPQTTIDGDAMLWPKNQPYVLRMLKQD